MPNNPQQLDPDALRLAKAIRTRESNNNPTAKGASGEYGYYQFTKPTWQKSAQKYLGDANSQLTPENQNKVAYSQIKEWKDAGYQPDQIASMWNSGKPDAHKTGMKGTNSYGVNYDVPAYVAGVQQEYQKLKQIEPQQQQVQQSSNVAQQPQQSANYQPKQDGLKTAGNIADFLFGGKKIGEAIGTGIAQGKFGSGIQKFVTGQDLTPEQESLVTAGPTRKEIVGDVARVGLNFTPYGKATGALTSRLAQEGLKRSAKPLANIAVGAGTGYAMDVAENARQNKENIYKPGAGTLVGGGLATLGSGASAGLRKLGQNTGQDRLEKLAGNYVVPSKIIAQESKRGRNPLQVIKEEGVLPEVINSKTDTSKMVEALSSRLEEASNATRNVLKDSGLVVPFKDFQKTVIDGVMGDETIRNLGQTDTALKQVMTILNSYKKSYGQNIPVTVIDDIRQTMNKNKWKPETHDIYRSIGDATRKIVYDAVPDQQVKKMLQREGELIGARDLAEALNARAVKSGLIGKHFETLLGGLAGMGAGAVAGPLGMGAGALTGALATRKVGDIARGAYFKTPLANMARKVTDKLDGGVVSPGDYLLKTQAGQKLENSLKESIKNPSMGLSAKDISKKIHPDDQAELSDFVDMVYGAYPATPKGRKRLLDSVNRITEKHGITLPAGEVNQAKKISKILDDIGFKVGSQIQKETSEGLRNKGKLNKPTPIRTPDNKRLAGSKSNKPTGTPDPTLKTKREVTAKTMSGEKFTIPQGAVINPRIDGGKVNITVGGKNYTIPKNQYENLKGQSDSAKATPFAPELKDTVETVRGGRMSDQIVWKDVSRPGERTVMNGTLGNRKFTIQDEGDGWYVGENDKQFGTTARNYTDALEKLDREFSQTKYSQYTLDGGENYREILIQAPLTEKGKFMSYEQFLKESKQGGLSDESVIKKRYKEFKSEAENQTFGDKTYQSSHWSEPNVISHIRMNERTVDGKKYAFMEELQSDWAREGRDKGFAGEMTLDEIAQQKYGKPYSELSSSQKDMVVQRDSRGVPNNPLLKDWQIPTTKRALIEAVDSGADRFAWINGEQTSARYNLATHLEDVKWKNGEIDLNPKGSAKIMFNIDEKGTIVKSELNADQFVGKKLDEVLGKGLADKIMEKETGTLSGDGLSFGGEWAKNLYDRQVRDIVKKLTGAEVKTVDMGLGDGNKQLADYKRQLKMMQTEKDVVNREAKIKELEKVIANFDGNIQTQQYIELTPEVKAKIQSKAPDFKMKNPSAGDSIPLLLLMLGGGATVVSQDKE